jgi:hypothetical protein
MLNPYFFQELLIGLVLFCLIGGYTIGSIVLALLGRTVHLKVAASFWALVLAYGLYVAGTNWATNWTRDTDFRFSIDGGMIYVTDRGPIAFLSFGDAVFGTTIEADGTFHEIGFRLSGVSEVPFPRDISACPTIHSDFYLDRILDARGYADQEKYRSCPFVYVGQAAFAASAHDARDFVMTCSLSVSPQSPQYCRMTLNYQHYGNLEVLLWRTPREFWKQSLDQVIAILDQSFKVELEQTQ